MKTHKKYYKVVRDNHSLNIHPRNGGVLYTLFEWTFPTIRGSKLCVFDSLEAAIRAKELNCGAHLYECEISSPSKAYIRRSNINDTIAPYWHIVADARRSKKSINAALINNGYYCHQFLDNTVFCNAVKLTKLIQ